MKSKDNTPKQLGLLSHPNWVRGLKFRFAINEINRVRDERILVENFRQLESKLTELIQTQEKNHHEIMEFLKNNRIISDNEQNESNKDNTNSSMENSIDSVIDMFNADTFLK